MPWTTGLSIASIYGLTWSARTANASGVTNQSRAIAPSSESRFNHLYPQVEAVGVQPFIWRIQSEFPWYVTTGNGVWIRSSITEQVY